MDESPRRLTVRIARWGRLWQDHLTRRLHHQICRASAGYDRAENEWKNWRIQDAAGVSVMTLATDAPMRASGPARTMTHRSTGWRVAIEDASFGTDRLADCPAQHGQYCISRGDRDCCVSWGSGAEIRRRQNGWKVLAAVAWGLPSAGWGSAG
jgi:hypothetical protein